VVVALTVPCVRYAPPEGWRLTACLGTWFTYAVMQIFFGGFSGLENRVGAVDINKTGDTVI